MIALIGVQSNAPRLRAEELPELPELPAPPAPRWAAFLVSAIAHRDLLAALCWSIELRRSRPMVPIGLIVADPESVAPILHTVGGSQGFAPVINGSDVPLGQIPPTILHAMAEATVASHILGEWAYRWSLRDASLISYLRQIAHHGASGARVKTLAVHSESGHPLSVKTVRRRLKKCGLPPVGALLREARVRAVELRIAGGTARRDATLLSNWSTPRLYDKVRRRR